MAGCMRKLTKLSKNFQKFYEIYGYQPARHAASRPPNSWELMTGKERWIAIQYAKGNLDPFFELTRKRGPGTKDCPNIVPSVHDKRLVGCLCDPHCNSLVWFWVYEGFPRRCKCNYWFVLERHPVPKIYEDC